MHDSGDSIQPLPKNVPPSGNMVLMAVLLVVAISILLFLYALFGPNLIFLLLLGIAIVGAIAIHFWLWGRNMAAADNDESDKS